MAYTYRKGFDLAGNYGRPNAAGSMTDLESITRKTEDTVNVQAYAKVDVTATAAGQTVNTFISINQLGSGIPAGLYTVTRATLFLGCSAYSQPNNTTSYAPLPFQIGTVSPTAATTGNIASNHVNTVTGSKNNPTIGLERLQLDIPLGLLREALQGQALELYLWFDVPFVKMGIAQFNLFYFFVEVEYVSGLLSPVTPQIPALTPPTIMVSLNKVGREEPVAIF